MKKKKSFRWSVNVSPSSIKLHGDCQRAWYLAKVLSWQGWNESAQEDRRIAYRCSKMESFAKISGTVVHELMTRLFAKMDTKAWRESDDTLEDLGEWIETEARERLAMVYRSRNNWPADPKRFPPIRELYYEGLMTDDQQREAWASAFQDIVRMAAEAARSSIVRQAAAGFRAGTLRSWREMSDRKHERSSSVSVPYGGEESGVTLWGVLDHLLAFDSGRGRVVVVDWKTGREREEEHQRQAEWYAWAAARILVRSGVWSEDDVENPDRQSIEVQMIYLDDIVPETGLARVVSRDLDPWELDVESIDRFAQAVENAPQRDISEFPKRTGPLCDFCDVRHSCTGSRSMEVKP